MNTEVSTPFNEEDFASQMEETNQADSYGDRLSFLYTKALRQEYALKGATDKHAVCRLAIAPVSHDLIDIQSVIGLASYEVWKNYFPAYPLIRMESLYKDPNELRVSPQFQFAENAQDFWSCGWFQFRRGQGKEIYAKHGKDLIFPNSENPKKRASQAEKFSITYGSAFTKVKVFTTDAYILNESEGTPPPQSWKFGEFIANPNGMKFYVPVVPVDEDNQPKVERPILLEVKANLLEKIAEVVGNLNPYYHESEKGRRKGTETSVEGRNYDTKHNPFVEIVYKKEEGGKPVAPEKVWTVRPSASIQEQFNSNLDEDEIPPHSWQNGQWEAIWDKHSESPYWDFIKRFKGSPCAEFIVDSLTHYYTGVKTAPDVKTYVQNTQSPSSPTSPSFERKTGTLNVSDMI